MSLENTIVDVVIQYHSMEEMNVDLEKAIKKIIKIEQANKELREEGINNTNILNQEIDKWKAEVERLRAVLKNIASLDHTPHNIICCINEILEAQQ